MTPTDLIARLRDDYVLGKSTYELMEAADALTAAQERIEALEEALRGLLLVMPKQNYHCENDEPAFVLNARHIAGTAARAALDATDNI